VTSVFTLDCVIMAVTQKVVAVTGASRGIGYAIGKELAMRVPGAQVYLTTRSVDNVQSMEAVLCMDIGSASDHVRFRKLDVKDVKSVAKFAEVIKKKHGQLDVLVNNAAIYYKPPATVHAACEMMPLFTKEVEEILRTNYFGLKSVVKAFLPILGHNSRIINIGSHLGTIDCINGEEPFSEDLRKAFTDPDITEKDLDDLVERFRLAVKERRWSRDGWPTCGYTVSKVAVNTYTGVLQRQLDRELCGLAAVTNSVHTGAYHSKMKLMKETTVSQVEGAEAVAYMATLGVPGVGNTSTKEMPRGSVLWHDLRVIDWTADSVRPRALTELF